VRKTIIKHKHFLPRFKK